MTGYFPQFSSNISAKPYDFLSRQTRSNMCIFWNFVIDFVLKEIKNAKNIITYIHTYCLVLLISLADLRMAKTSVVSATSTSLLRAFL